MAVVSKSYLLETGVHFGHQTKKWNPKMKEYIFTARDEIYIIDLEKTSKKIEEAYAALKEIVSQGGKVIFVGTRKQAQEAIKEEAIRSDSFYINERWLGGTLTNFKTIRRRVKRLDEIEAMEKNGLFEALPKKEIVGIRKEYDKLNKILGGIREMKYLPRAMFVIDPIKEDIAIREAKKLNIPVFALVDTNCDPDMIDYVIPGNDDAVRAVKLITSVMANAIVEANGGTLVNHIDENETNEDIMVKAIETVKRREERRKEANKKRFNKPFDRNNRYNNRRDNKFSNSSRPASNGDRPSYNGSKPAGSKPTYNAAAWPKRPATNTVKPVANTAKPVVNAVKPVVKPVVKTVKPVVKEVKKPSVDFTKNTAVELRAMAKDKAIKGYSTMKKAELIEALNK